MNNAPKLLPCPFCGGDAEADARQPFWHYSTGKTCYQAAIYCTRCTVNMTLCHADHPEVDTANLAAELVAAWNRRADTAPLAVAAMRDAAVKALRDWQSDLIKHRFHDTAVTVGIAADLPETIPLPTPAEMLAAALRVPEVAAMKEAALHLAIEAHKNMRGGKGHLIDNVCRALAALTPAIGETDKGAGE